MPRILPGSFLHLVDNIIGNSFHLYTGLGIANNKEVGYGIGYFSEVEAGYVLRFFIQGSLYYLVSQRFKLFFLILFSYFRAQNGFSSCFYQIIQNFCKLLILLFTTTNNILLGKVLHEHALVGSTNDQAKILLSKSKPAEGTVIIAHHQHRGKGQYGNLWNAQPGENLTFSIVLYPKFLSAAKQFLLSQAVALGIRDALKPMLPGPVAIKWPNDIMASGKKVCGILIENSVQGHLLADSVVGIGINVNQTNFDGLPHASSLALLAGQPFDLNLVLHKVLTNIEGCYLQLLAGREQQIGQQYLQHLYLLNQPARFQAMGQTFDGTIRGIDASGRLLIEDATGTKAYGVKEVGLA